MDNISLRFVYDLLIKTVAKKKKKKGKEIKKKKKKKF